MLAREGVTLGVLVREGVTLGVLVAEGVTLGVLVAEGVTLGVLVAEGVTLGVLVAEGVTLGVLVAEGVTLGVLVAEGVTLGVLVFCPINIALSSGDCNSKMLAPTIATPKTAASARTKDIDITEERESVRIEGADCTFWNIRALASAESAGFGDREK